MCTTGLTCCVSLCGLILLGDLPAPIQLALCALWAAGALLDRDGREFRTGVLLSVSIIALGAITSLPILTIIGALSLVLFGGLDSAGLLDDGPVRRSDGLSAPNRLRTHGRHKNASALDTAPQA